MQLLLYFNKVSSFIFKEIQKKWNCKFQSFYYQECIRIGTWISPSCFIRMFVLAVCVPCAHKFGFHFVCIAVTEQRSILLLFNSLNPRRGKKAHRKNKRKIEMAMKFMMCAKYIYFENSKRKIRRKIKRIKTNINVSKFKMKKKKKLLKLFLLRVFWMLNKRSQICSLSSNFFLVLHS